jgi:hypothetical protein
MSLTQPLGRLPRLRAFAAIGLLLASLGSASCAMPLSPADLARNENHAYPGRSKGQVFRATATALRSLGYQLVVSDEGSGLIKTAPKVMTAVAYGNAYGAVATENSIGWTIGVTPIEGGVGLHADPRGYSGGQAVAADQMNGAYMEKLFGTLYGEIDTNLPPPK